MTPGSVAAAGGEGATFRRTLRRRHAIALYVSSVLGSGILVLPGLAADLAGPASLIAWALIAAASLPFALTFAALSARHPEAGGIYGFAREAFGPGVAQVTGWLFALWMVTGAPAVALIAASYLGYAFPLTRPETFLLGYAIVAVPFLINYGGILLSGRVQLAVLVAIVGLLVAAIALSGLRVSAGNFVPFAPNGIAPIGTAAALIVWSFLGYENVSNVAEEFQDPRRDLPRSIGASVAVIAALYVGVAVVTIGTGAYRSGGGVAPFAALLGNVVGPYGAMGTALLAALIIFGVVNAYTTGMSRVFYAAAKDGAFPRSLARLDPASGAPGRALLVLFAILSGVFVAYYVLAVDLESALLVSSGTAIFVYVIGTAAGVRLRPPLAGRRRWMIPAISLGTSLVVAPFVGPLLLVPAGVTAAALVAYVVRPPRGGPSAPPPGTPTAK